MKKNLLKMSIAVAAVTVMFSCGGGEKTITVGNKSTFDTLSYALGANIAEGVKWEFRDIPFDYKTSVEGINAVAKGKAKMTHEEALDMLRDYFMGKRSARMQLVAKKYDEADSVRLAQGDTTKVERPVADPDMFESEEERHDLSYAFGVDIGNNLNNSGLAVQTYWLGTGLLETVEGNGKMTEEEVGQYLNNYFMEVVPARNKEASDEWLSKVEKKWGVKKTESGLLYKVVKQGDSEVKASNPRDVVKVKYVGTNRKGEEFDSTYGRVKELKEQIKKVKKDTISEEEKIRMIERLETQLTNSETATFPLNRVIPGWTEGMQLVGKGGKIILWIPGDLAYGVRGAGPKIGPNDALKFEVEIVDVEPYEDPAAKKAAEAETEAAEVEE